MNGSLMQGLKYHTITTTSVVFFSFVLAVTINGIVRHAILPQQTSARPSFAGSIQSTPAIQPIDINSILNSGFFRVSNADSNGSVSSAIQDAGDIVLLGTITGASPIARALIRKRSENESKIFPLWSDVYGYKLVRIDNAKIYLKSGTQVKEIDMFALANQGQSGTPSSTPQADGADRIKKTLSKADIQQKLQGKIDTMLRGLRAGPYVINGKIEGYKLFFVSPENFLSTIGAKSGDVIKRVNGQQIDSTEKMFHVWSGLTQETRVVLDIEREGKTITYDYTFTD
jgi:general secretion pathway protein C